MKISSREREREIFSLIDSFFVDDWAVRASCPGFMMGAGYAT